MTRLDRGSMSPIPPMLALLCLGPLPSCSLPPDDGPLFEGGGHTVRHVDGGLAIAHQGRQLFQLTGISRRTFEKAEVSSLFGFYDFETEGEETLPLAFGEASSTGDGVTLVAPGGGEFLGELRFSLTEAGQLGAAVTLGDGVAADALRLTFACGAADRFWGFGEQYNFVDLRGQQVPIWVQEQGVGRAERPPLPWIGGLTDSYFPMPYFVDPQAGKGFLLTNSEHSRFDLCSEGAPPVGDPAAGPAWSVEVWSRQAGFKVFAGPRATDVVSQLTAEVGRPARRPPDWALSGVVIAGQGGREAVETRLKTAVDAGVPVSAVWVQDWVGARELVSGNFGVKYRWNIDETLYPQLDQMIARLRRQGVRFLGYFNPFVIPDYEQYKEGSDKGYLVKQPSGETYDFLIISFRGGLLDVTNPDAVSWFQGFARRALDLGMSGWMADFGEWLPYDAKIAQGESPSFHNRYPTEWHRINREVLDERFADGDYLMLTRSGYTGEHEVAQVVWAGDQEADWSETDGLPTVVTAALTLGLSGIPYFTHDVAGFSGGPRGKELYRRWTELGALSPIMRTHDGLRKHENHHFDSDAETLAHFSTFSRIHQALAPHWIALAEQARQDGLPMIRHTALVDPEWPAAYEAHGQWALGQSIVFAPVLKPGAAEVEVWLPEGRWEHLLTGEALGGREAHRVAAPIGRPAVFVRQGALAEVVRQVRAIYGEGSP